MKIKYIKQIQQQLNDDEDHNIKVEIQEDNTDIWTIIYNENNVYKIVFDDFPNKCPQKVIPIKGDWMDYYTTRIQKNKYGLCLHWVHSNKYWNEIWEDSVNKNITALIIMITFNINDPYNNLIGKKIAGLKKQ